MNHGQSTAVIATGSDLCVRCGLCCGGTVFDFVPLAPDERESMEALGLDPHEDSTGDLRFNLPCPRLAGTLCGIYEQRPKTCRAFECQLLTQFQRGETDGQQALEIVAEARRLIDEVKLLLGDEELPIVPKRWTALFEAMPGRKDSITPSTVADGRAILGLTILNRFLDRHFRLESQRVVKERPVTEE